MTVLTDGLTVPALNREADGVVVELPPRSPIPSKTIPAIEADLTPILPVCRPISAGGSRKEGFVQRISTCQTSDAGRRVVRPGRCLGLLGIAACLLMVPPVLAQPAPAQKAPELPPGFQVPRETPPELSIEKELLSEGEYDKWRKEEAGPFGSYSNALAAAQVDAKTQLALTTGVRVQVHQLSMKANRDDLTKIRTDIIRQFDANAKSAAIRKFMLGEFTKRAAELLDGNIHTRYHAVQLLGELNLVPPGIGVRATPGVGHIDAVPVLLEVLQAPQGKTKQPEAVKILAAISIARQLQSGRSTLQSNSKIPVDTAQVIVSELTSGENDWYRIRLIEALIQTAVPSIPSGSGQMATIEPLARIMADPAETHEVRVAAAFNLGRAVIAPGVNSTAIAWSLTESARMVAADLNAGRIPPQTALFLVQDLFLACRPRPGELTVDGKKAGLINTLSGKPVADAAAAITAVYVDLVSKIAVAKPPATYVLRAELVTPLQVAKPSNLSVLGGGTPVTTPLRKRAAPVAPATAPAPAPNATAQPAGGQPGGA